MRVNYLKLGYIPQNTGDQFYAAINEINEIQGGTSMYQYTTTSVLNAILKSASLRATNIFYTGDSNTYKDGVEHLKKVFNDEDDIVQNYLKKIEKLNAMSHGGVYSISFTKKIDSRPEWSLIKNEPGVCIEFDPKIIWNSSKKLLLGEKTNKRADCTISSPCFRNVIYISNDNFKKEDPDKYKEVFARYILKQYKGRPVELNIEDNTIEKCWTKYQDDAIAFLMLLASYYKKHFYEDDEEICAAFLPLCRRNDNGAKISFIEAEKGVLQPYIDINFYHIDDERKYVREIPIKSIMIGPGRNQNKVYHSIIHRLENEEHCTWKYPPEELQERYQNYLNAFYKYAGIGFGEDKEEYVFYFLKGISRSIDFDIYYQKPTYEIWCGSLPDTEKDTYTLFGDDEKIKVSEKFMEFQEKQYMTADGILILKSEMPVEAVER